ncbi:MAG: saccharopine dehydrogenase, partial [Crocinitomicaceae bacterium]|nr:saccharopine dehydrogenase [Crocinitomicaceae bacterium]
TNTENLTPRSFLNAFLPYNSTLSIEEKFKTFIREDRMDLFERFKWLGLFENEPLIGIENATPAQVLQQILVKKLSLSNGDKDMLVMIHEFEYKLNNKQHKITSHMVNIGEDQIYTSMSNTVGLPAAICGKMILNGTLKTKGVTLPVQPEVYEPILTELEEFNICFVEEEKTL